MLIFTFQGCEEFGPGKLHCLCSQCGHVGMRRLKRGIALGEFVSGRKTYPQGARQTGTVDDLFSIFYLHQDDYTYTTIIRYYKSNTVL